MRGEREKPLKTLHIIIRKKSIYERDGEEEKIEKRRGRLSQ